MKKHRIILKRRMRQLINESQDIVRTEPINLERLKLISLKLGKTLNRIDNIHKNIRSDSMSAFCK